MEDQQAKTKIANRILELRTDAKLTQEKFGALFGLSKFAVSCWENGKVENIKRETLISMSERFHVNPLWIMGFNVPKMARTAQESELEQQITDRLAWLNETQLRKLLKFMEEFL